LFALPKACTPFAWQTKAVMVVLQLTGTLQGPCGPATKPVLGAAALEALCIEVVKKAPETPIIATTAKGIVDFKNVVFIIKSIKIDFKLDLLFSTGFRSFFLTLAGIFL
jgi:hypothetical protein